MEMQDQSSTVVKLQKQTEPPQATDIKIFPSKSSLLSVAVKDSVSVPPSGLPAPCGEASAPSSVVPEAPPAPAGTTVVASTAPDTPASSRGHSVIQKYSITGRSESLALANTPQSLVLCHLAKSGELTVIFAEPGTGKTLLAWALLDQAIQLNPDLAPRVSYLNADDNYAGMMEKLALAEELGIDLLVPGFEGFVVEAFPKILADMCARGQAAGAVVILDTLKKFVDLMNKSAQRIFWQGLRQFVAHGGTVIALAHTNKKRGADGRPVPEGTADTRNDADCVYVCYETGRDDATKTKSVVFENIKSRGSTPQLIGFRYSYEQGLKYSQLLSTVEVVQDLDMDQVARSKPASSDDQIVAAITTSLQQGSDTKMRLRDAAAALTGASKRKVLDVIDIYTGADPAAHKWNFQRGEHGRMYYTLLIAPAAEVPNAAE